MFYNASGINSSAPGISSSTLGLIQVGTQVAGQASEVISGIVNAKQQAQYQESFKNLSLSQQNDLNNKIATSNDNNQKLQILTNALVASKTKNKTGNNTILIIAIGGIIIMGGLFIILKRKNASRAGIK